MHARPAAPDFHRTRDPRVLVRSRLWPALGALALSLGVAACPGEAPIRHPPPDGAGPADTARPETAADGVPEAGGDKPDASDTATPDAPDTATAPRTLCDGSNGARLVYVNRGGGPLEPAFSFYGAYGHEFFVIDGTCRYWAQRNYLDGIRTGVLDAAAANEIARRLHHADFATLPANNGMGCPDASVRGLSDGNHKVLCQCTCATGTDSPAAVRETFTALAQVQEQLLKGGAAVLPIRIIATDNEEKPGSVPNALVWPLAWSPREVVVPVFPSVTPDAGRLVSAETDLTALRALRVMAVAKNVYGSIPVKTTANEILRVYPRDVAPTAVTTALDAFKF